MSCFCSSVSSERIEIPKNTGNNDGSDGNDSDNDDDKKTAGTHGLSRSPPARARQCVSVGFREDQPGPIFPAEQP